MAGDSVSLTPGDYVPHGKMNNLLASCDTVLFQPMLIPRMEDRISGGRNSPRHCLYRKALRLVPFLVTSEVLVYMTPEYKRTYKL